MIGVEEQLFIALDVLIASVLGGVIGYEREQKDKPAGFRTHMLIAGAAALIITLGMHVPLSLKGELSPQSLGVDPTRLIEAVIVGVSFIGAGTVWKSDDTQRVRFLTTAASILFSASVGISVALHMYVLAGCVAVLGLLINGLLAKFS